VFQLVVLRLTESYFRHRWLHLLPIIMMTAVAFAYPATVEPTYMTSGTIYIQSETLLSSLTAIQNENFGWVSPSEATAAEMYQLINVNAFLEAVAQQTDLGIELTGDPQDDNALIEELRKSVWFSTLGNNLLAINTTYKDPRVAYQLATSVINTYLQWKINLKLEGSKAAQHFFIELIDDYRAELDPARQELTNYLASHPEPLRGERPPEEAAEIARLRAIVDQGLERVRSAESKEENARLAMVQTESDIRQTYFTVDEPILPVEADLPLKEVAIAMIACLVGGFMLTAISVAGGALLDRTFRFPIDIRHGLNLPLLALVPESREDKWFVSPKSPVATGISSDVRRTMGNERLVPIKTRKPQRLFG
jgi:capsular polysaccharide biosynthesis protein